MFNKLIYSVLAVASLGAFAACTSSSDDGVEAPATQVQFRVADVSRSSLTNNDNITSKSFAVYGDMVSTSAAAGTKPTLVFPGTKVAYNGTNWAYENTQYWFPGQTYSFVAVHPQDNSAAVSDLKYENNSVSFKYNFPSTYSNAVDVLTATHRRRYQTGNPHAVAFDFKHILARIDFVAKVDPQLEITVQVNHLTMRNVSTGATYTITPASTTTETADYTDGWSDFTDAKATLFDRDFDVTLTKDNPTSDLFPIASDPLLIIPQEVSQNLEVEIAYTVSGAVKTAKANLFSTTVASHGGRWVAGQSYTYNFTLGDNDVILFTSPTIQSWSEAEGANYVVTD